MSDPLPDPGGSPSAATPGPQSEPGVGDTEVFASAEFATGPREAADSPTESAQPAQSPEPVAPPAPVQWPAPPAGKSGRRAVWAIGLGVGYVVLAAGTAFGVIIDKSPTAVDVTAVNASAYAAPVSAAGTSSAPAKQGTKSTSSASPAAAPTTQAPTSAPSAATPTSTVTGSVSGGIHSGDLRYFLVPPPQGPSSVQGNPDGTIETLAEAVTAYGGDSSQDSILQGMGFKAACTRTYQDSTIGANVSVQLIQFKSAYDAEQWTSSFGLSGAGFASISVPGVSGAKGWSYASSGTYNLVGVYREGDTFFQVQVYGTQLIPAPDLGQIVGAQHSRLANG